MIFGKYVNKYYIKYLLPYILGIAALVVVDIAQLKVPEIYRLVINGLNDGCNTVDGVSVPFDMDFLLDSVCLPMIIVIIIMVVCRFTWRYCFFGAAVDVETDLRDKMFDRCKDLSQDFYLENKVGNLMSLFTNDLESVHECFGSGTLAFFDASFLGTLALVKMFRMNPVMTLFSMIPMVILVAMSVIMGKYMSARWDKRQAAFSDISDFTQETFSGLSVVKAFVKEGKKLSEFSRLNKKNEDANVSYVKLSSLFNVLVTFFTESVICVILGYGGYLVYKGSFDAGRLVEFIGYFTAMIWPIMAISDLVDMSSQGRASLKRISALLDTVPSVRDREGALSEEEIGEIKGDIEFRNLTFSHPGSDHNNLHSISLKINAGENVGIIGSTGSGKTTAVDLMLHIYNPPDGTVFIDGHDINLIPIKMLRDACAYVPQDNFLFSDTIANNISFAVDNAPREDIERAAKIACVDSNITEFNYGYDTVLGERGATVSGGQKQRISIARAILKKAKILIMDDSVSAVDTATERMLIDNLRAERKGCTTILIAHRVSSVENMDKIIFMHRGKILACGSHNELMESCPEYKKTVLLQQLEERERTEGNV